MGRRQSSGMTEARRHRANEALKHRKDGRGYEWIAKELGVSLSTAHGDVQKALREITKDNAEEVVQLELERIDQMWLRLNTEFARVVKAAKEGEMEPEKMVSSVTRIVDSQLRVQERRAKLLGVDSPQKVDLGGHVDLDATVAKIMTAAELVMNDDGPEGGADGDDGVVPGSGDY